MIRRPLALVVGVMLLSAQAIRAGESWVGEKVMAAKSEVKFGDRDGERQVYFELKGVVFPVLKEQDGWLRIRGTDGKEGWADKADFVLLRDAPVYYTDLIHKNEKDAWAWNKRAIAWAHKGELDNAIKDYTEYIRLEPKSATGYTNRGIAWRDKKEYDKAIRDYDEAIRLDPTNDTAFNNRGNVWLVMKEYDKAIRDYDEAIRLDPEDASHLGNRGLARYAKREFDKAIRDYDEAVRLNPKDPDFYQRRGGAWRAKTEYDKAIRDYDEAIRLDPKHVRAHFSRSVARMLMQRPDAAAGFQGVLDLDGWKGSRAVYAVILGHLAARQAQDKAAAKRFRAESAGKLAEAWPYPAVQFLRGEIDEPALLKLATDDDKRTEARCYLGLDHALKGRTDEALAHFRWVKEHGTKTFTEYTIAVAELDRLERSPKGAKP